MQLPRGTFRALKKGCALNSLIDELVLTAFSGYCRIIADSRSVTLVFQQGIILLAEYDTLQGDSAWTRIVQDGRMIADAVINDLTAPQVDLAIEFSPQARVTNTQPPRKGGDQGDQRGPAQAAVPVPDDTGGTREPFRRGSGPVRLYESAETVRIAAGAQDSAPPLPGDNDLFLLKDLESLDAMDIENIAEKFRANCRLMIERLNLEHLITQKSKKEAP